MTDTEKALELVQKCLDDWPYAATRVVDIMTRLEKVKELLKEQEGEWLDVDDEQNAFDCSICGAMVGRKCLYCPGCGAKMKNGTRAIECV